MSNPHLDELLRLPVADRLAAIEELWESLDTNAELFPLTDEERAELDRRIAADEADHADPGISWPELRRRLEQDNESRRWQRRR
jgi:putative addiction module component (TIGR02574 family)